MKKNILAAALALAATHAHAVDYLTEVTSDVQQAPGMNVDQILNRALQCLQSTSGNRANVVDAAIDGDTAYAVIDTDYKFLFKVSAVRSRISVYARDQRFKIVHTDIDNGTVNPLTQNPMRVTRQAGSPANNIETALAERSTTVSSCITKPQETAASDW